MCKWLLEIKIKAWMTCRWLPVIPKVLDTNPKRVRISKHIPRRTILKRPEFARIRWIPTHPSWAASTKYLYGSTWATWGAIALEPPRPGSKTQALVSHMLLEFLNNINPGRWMGGAHVSGAAGPFGRRRAKNPQNIWLSCIIEGE